MKTFWTLVGLVVIQTVLAVLIVGLYRAILIHMSLR